MKKLYFLFFLTIGFLANAQIVNIPDANFKAKLLSANPSNTIASTQTPNSFGGVTSYHTIDTNGDGEIQVTEAQAIKYLNIENSNISNSTGIAAFTNLEFLNFSYNQITSLDVTLCSNLKRLFCQDNQLTGLDVALCSSLELLLCQNNQLISLDVTQNSNLKTLNCSNNQLVSLDMTQNSNLTSLFCSTNQLAILDVTYNPGLFTLHCSSNQLTSLDVSQNLSLASFYCNFNQLSSLNVSQNTNINNLNCGNNQLLSLDVTQNSLLQTFDCISNQLTNLDVTQNPNLRWFWCYANQLSSLDVTQNPSLEWFFCGTNQLSSIDLTQNSNLTNFFCDSNQLTSLDISQNYLLNVLNCSSNLLTNLNTSNNSQLQRLTCGNNLFTTIDVTSNSGLWEFNCNNTPSLQALFIKNGGSQFSWPSSSLHFLNNPNLEFVCCNSWDLAVVQQKIVDYGYTNCYATDLSCDYPFSFEVSGNVRYDYWYDGCDINDVFVPNVKYEIFDGTSTSITFGNQVGDYFIPLESGSYTITPVLENPTYFESLPSNLVVDFTAPSPPVVQNFCVVDLDYLTDLEIVMLPLTPARPGFEATYRVIVRNKAHDYETGSVTFTYDNAILSYASSTPMFNSSTTNSVTWLFNSIGPFETIFFDITLDVNSPTDTPAVNNGDELTFTASINNLNPDNTPADNTFTLDQTVVGSYDPNDKVCLQGETEDVSIVGEFVHYMIRFENTGTFLAEKVVVEDFIDITKFDVSTLIPLHASHSYYTKITGNKVEFIFDNINLDFNDPNNDGYISFKIKLLPTLTIGDTFSNYVNIYFDFNPPIVTNTYTTTIVALNSTSFEFNNHFVLYPNPAKETVSIQSKDGIGINSIEIYNNIGQMIHSTTNTSNTIAISNLASGIYFVKVNTDKGTTNTKFIKE